MKKIFFSIVLLSVISLSMGAETAVAAPGTVVNNVSVGGSEYAGTEAVIKAYLSVKDALVADNSVAAARSGKVLSSALQQMEKDAASPAEKKAFSKDGQAAVKNAAAIAGTKDIAVQRKIFKDLSEHLYHLVKVAGTSTSLYLDYCPMAKATWLSDTKPVSNPYYGKSMLTCGSVRETIEP